MYYTELEQRDVFVQDDPENGFKIWGEIAGRGPATSVSLCQMFLEYAMYSHSWCSPDEAIYNIKAFGKNLGLALANFIKSYFPNEESSSRGTCGLMCLLESMNVKFEIMHVGNDLRFIFANCPLTEVAQQTGLGEVDLALYGVNAMCQSLVNALDPELVLHAPQTAAPLFTYEVESVG
jgi:hypothetical protein